MYTNLSRVHEKNTERQLGACGVTKARKVLSRIHAYIIPYYFLKCNRIFVARK